MGASIVAMIVGVLMICAGVLDIVVPSGGIPIGLQFGSELDRAVVLSSAGLLVAASFINRAARAAMLLIGVGLAAFTAALLSGAGPIDIGGYLALNSSPVIFGVGAGAMLLGGLAMSNRRTQGLSVAVAARPNARDIDAANSVAGRDPPSAPAVAVKALPAIKSSVAGSSTVSTPDTVHPRATPAIAKPQHIRATGKLVASPPAAQRVQFGSVVRPATSAPAPKAVTLNPALKPASQGAAQRPAPVVGTLKPVATVPIVTTPRKQTPVAATAISTPGARLNGAGHGSGSGR